MKMSIKRLRRECPDMSWTPISCGSRRFYYGRAGSNHMVKVYSAVGTDGDDTQWYVSQGSAHVMQFSTWKEARYK